MRLNPWGVMAVAGVCLAAAAQAQQLPVFRAGVELLEVDVSVVDGQGEPITDLGASEFTVSVDGEPRQVVSVQFVDLRPAAAVPPDTTVAAPDVSYSANTASNAGNRGRLILLAIDRESISFGEGQRVMRAAGDFLDTLGPSDQVALVTVPPPGPSADFTTNHQLVRNLLEDASGAGRGGVRPDTMTVSDAIAIASGNLNVMLRMCRNSNLPDCETTVTSEAWAILTDVRRQTMQSVWALEGLLDRLSDIEGRKYVVWISEELLTPDNGTELLRVRSLAAAAQTSVHVLLLDKPYLALVSPQERQLEELGLQLMADYTGGTVNRVVSDAGPAFARIEREISGYYLLGVEPLEDDLDGNQHEIDVSVQRPGARVRARREVVHQAGGPQLTAEERLRRLLGSPLAASDLPLRVATYQYREADSSRVRVLVAVDVERDPADPEVTFGYLLVGEDGEIVSSGGASARPAAMELSWGPWVEQFDSLVVDPGRYTLKLAAVEEGGRHGSLVHELDATGGSELPVAVSDLVLGTVPADDAAAVRPSVEPRLTDGRLMTYLELYGDDPARLDDVEVRIDVAGSPAGAALISQEGESAPMATAAGAAVSTVVRVDVLPPGHYVARAVVTRGEEEIGRQWRSFQIVHTAARLAGYRWRDARTPAVTDVAPTQPAGPGSLTADGQGREDEGETAFLPDIVRPLVRAEMRGRLLETGKPFSFEPSFFAGMNGRTYIPYTIRVDGGRLDARAAELYVCVIERGTADSTGGRNATTDDPACVFEDAHATDVTPPAEGEAAMSRALDLPPGNYDVYAAVRNGSGGAGTPQGAGGGVTLLLVKEALTVPDFETPEFRLSSVLVGDVEPLDAPLPPERQQLEPYTIGTFRVMPRHRLRFSRREELSFLYFVHGAGPPGGAKPDLTVEYLFHRATIAGEQLFSWTDPEDYNAQTVPPEFDMTRGHQIVAGRAVPLEPLPVGSYRLEIRVTDNTSGAVATRDVAFTVQPAAL